MRLLWGACWRFAPSCGLLIARLLLQPSPTDSLITLHGLLIYLISLFCGLLYVTCIEQSSLSLNLSYLAYL